MNKTCIECGAMYSKSASRLCNVCRNGRLRYNMNRLQQEALLASQQGKCMICRSDISLHDRTKNGAKSTGNIDHCHLTKRVRGILCHSCNVTLGYLENKNIDLDFIKEYLTVR